MSHITKRAARLQDEVGSFLFCFSFTVQACIFRDHVISDCIWAFFWEAVAVLSLSYISTAGSGGLVPWPGSKAHAIQVAMSMQRRAWAEFPSWLRPSVFNCAAIYFCGTLSERRRPSLKLCDTEFACRRFSLSANTQAGLSLRELPLQGFGMMKTKSCFPGQERFSIIQANRA